MGQIFLGLGSNQGDRVRNLAQGVACLARLPGVEIRQRSSLYDSAPLGPDQPRYLNAVVEAFTSFSACDLLQACKEIERRMGRVDGPRWGPRPLDIDLLLGDEIIALPHLQIPHLEMHKRAFVLCPLCEIAPEAWHPVLEQSIRQLAAAVAEQDVHRVGDFCVDL